MRIILGSLFFICIQACKPEVSDVNKTNKVTLEGIWQSDGYGYILTIKNDSIRTFDVTTFNCLATSEMLLDDFLLAEEFEIKNLKKNSFTTNVITSKALSNTTRHITFNRLKTLPKNCQNTNTVQKDDPYYNFNSIWHTFNEHYSFFKERDIDWRNYKTRYLSKITQETTSLEFYLILEEMLQSLNDGHSTIFVPEELEKAYTTYLESERLKKAAKSNKKPIGINIDEVRYNVVDTYVDSTYTYNFGMVTWGNISKEIVLIQINGMNNLANYPIKIPEDLDFEDAIEFFEEAYEDFANKSKHYTLDEIKGAKFIMDSIVNQVRGVNTCILDLRFNGGGYDDAGREILRHFISEKINLGTTKARKNDGYTKKQESVLTPSKINFTGNLIILTSPHTASAAESFTLGTMQINEALRIGDNTRGIFSDMLLKQMPNGWQFGMSNEVFESPEGVNYEVKGIPPNYKIEYPKKLFLFMKTIKDCLEKTGKDEALEKAIKIASTK